MTRDHSDKESVFERFFQLTPAMLCIADFSGRFLEVNQAFERVLGRTKEELTSEPFYTFIHPDDRAMTAQVMERIINQESISDFENRYLCRDGTWKTISWHTVSFQDNARIYAEARDVTQIRAIERALRANERNLAITLNSIGEGVIVTNPERKITFLNPIASDLVGWTIEEVLDRHLEDILIFSPEQGKNVPFLLTDPLFLRPGVTRQVARQGHSHIVAHSVTSLQDEAGLSIGYVVVIRDVTQEIQSRQELERQTAKNLRFQQALLRLRDFDTGDLNSLFALATEQCSMALEIERASIWIFRDDHSYIECVDLYCASSHSHSAGQKLHSKDYPTYFEALVNMTPIIAHEAQSHPVTSVFRDSYLIKLGIQSMIDIPIRAGGELIGVVCCEHVGTAREWIATEVKFATSLAASIMLAIEQNQRLKAEHDLRELNATLEKRIAQRTAELVAKEARLRALFDSQFQFIGLLSPEGILLEANDAFLQITAEPAESILGRHFCDTPWWREEDRPRLRDAITRAASGAFVRYEVEIQGPNQRLISVDFSIKPVTNDSGEVTLLIPEARDITERKVAEKALRDGENRFRLMLEQVEDHAIFLLDTEGRVANWNRGAEKAKGFLAHEVLGQHFSIFYPPNDVAAGKPYTLLQTAREKGSAKDEGWRVRRDGTLFWAGVTITALRDEMGHLTGFAKVSHDLSERRRAEIAIRESEEQFRSAMENSAVGMALVGLDGSWLKVNRALAEFFGRTEAELLATDFQSLTYPEDLQSDLALMEATLHGDRTSYQMEKRYIRKDGEIVWALLNVAIVRDAQGLPKYFISQIQDISQRKKADEILQNALLHEKELVRRAKAGEKAKSDFLAVMSHEIRTPLNGILGFADLLVQSPDLDQEKHDHARTIVESGESLLRILDDILDFSRLEVGRMKIEKRPFSPHKLVHDIGTLLYPLARKKGLEIRYDIDPSLSTIRSGDGTRVRQILLNLGGNAVKFTDKGSVTFCATTLPEEPDWVEFSVADTGPGIPAVLRESIFEPFIQGDLSSSRKHTGSGLGLAICRRLARLMGGSLMVRSEEGKGSCFSLSLPLGNPGRFQSGTSDRHFKMSQEDKDLSQNYPLRIIVAEDDQTSLKLIQRILKLFGYEVFSATNGKEAVLAYETHKPDLILMDLQMPEMDGIAATRRIRSLEESDGETKCFISALTANIVPEDRDRCFAAGMNSYLNKPIKKDQLVQLLVEASTYQKTMSS